MRLIANIGGFYMLVALWTPSIWLLQYLRKLSGDTDNFFNLLPWYVQVFAVLLALLPFSSFYWMSQIPKNSNRLDNE